MSDTFDKTDEKCQNRPENQELGPILGQNGDPDLIKLFPTLPTPQNPFKNQKTKTSSEKKCYTFLYYLLYPSRLYTTDAAHE